MADDEEIVEEEETGAPAGAADSEPVISPVETAAALAPPKYEVRPGLGEKFQAANVRDIIQTIMKEQLLGRAYRSDQAPRWAKSIANGVRQKVQELDMKRYKIVVSCVLIETKGAGIKCAQRCMWDPETDDYIDDLYKSDTLFCHTTVYGLYMY